MKKVAITMMVGSLFLGVAHANNTFTLNGQSISGMSGNSINGQKVSNKNVASYNGIVEKHSDNGVYMNGVKIGNGPKPVRKKGNSMLGNVFKKMNIFSSK